MNDLKKRFPSKSEPAERLQALADEARRLHAQNPGRAGDKEDSMKDAAVPDSLAYFSALLAKARMGVLDLAAVVVIAILCSMLVVKYRANEQLARSGAGPLTPLPAPADDGQDPPTPAPKPKPEAVEPIAIKNDFVRLKHRALLAIRSGAAVDNEAAIDSALLWLARHQESDGHWETSKWDCRYRTNTAVSGLSLLALLGAGHTEKTGKYKDNVKRAVAWLISKQQENGLIFDQQDEGAHRGTGYPHGIATLGLVEAAATSGSAEVKKAAQLAVDYCVLHQSPEGGWRYSPKSPGDVSVSGWYLSALKTAQLAKLNVPAHTMERGMVFLDSTAVEVTTAKTKTYRYNYMPGGATNARRTAIGALCRYMHGVPKADVDGTVLQFIADRGVPKAQPTGEDLDLYYYYYGSLAAFQSGGKTWANWYAALNMTLIPLQRTKGDEAGSWDPVGDFSGEWGRVGQTALAALCLETPYRSLRITPCEDAPADELPDCPEEIVPAAAQREAALRKKLETKVSFHFTDKPIPEVVTFLGQLTELRFRATETALKHPLNATLRVSEMPLNQALEWLCKVTDLEYRVEPDGTGNATVVLDVPKPKAAPSKGESDF